MDDEPTTYAESGTYESKGGMMYDFKWDDPLSWIAIGVPVVVFASIIIGIWEGLKWLMN